jgi:dihydrolipoamide dehydrogenase
MNQLQPKEGKEPKQSHPPQPLLKVLSFITSLLPSQKQDR